MINSNYSRIKKAFKKYSDFLESVSEEEFQRTPNVGVWSYSEVYSHIFVSNILSFKGIEICIEGKAENVRKPVSIYALPWLVLGMLPPGKFKVPRSIADKVKKMNIQEAKELIAKADQKLEHCKDKINLASRYQKIKHPRFGPFNARNWFRFILMHSKHHLKQLERIRKLPGMTVPS